MAAIRVFEGEPDHLIPSVSEELLENNMFTIAGRMIGHSFLHNGPRFPGLSPAIIHVLVGGSPETAPVTIRDCPDLDIREIIEKVSRNKNASLCRIKTYIISVSLHFCFYLFQLEGDVELKEEASIHQLCLSWDFPSPSKSNRKWLAKKLLLHTVMLDLF